MKVAVIGAGSSYTPELINGFLERIDSLPLKELWLMDILPDMTRFFLGIDIGGTKSHALIADEQGRAVGFGVGGPGNWRHHRW